MSLQGGVHHLADLKRIKTHPMFRCPYLGSRYENDICKDFYMEIVTEGIESAYNKYGTAFSYEPKNITPSSKKSVIVIGAGLAGLVAAFELEKAGYNVQILERQYRVGGRTKTLRDGFATGLHAEGGAMRIPSKHYLTKGYVEKFSIPVRHFINKNENAYIYLEGFDKIRIKDWESSNKMYSDLLFPGWNSKLAPSIQKDVEGILDLFSKTIQPVIDELYANVKENSCNTGFESWVEKWSKLTIGDFLRTSVYEKASPSYRPWPEEAITGLEITTGIPNLSLNLVDFLHTEIDEYWSGELTVPVNGMDSIAMEFIKCHKFPSGKYIDLSKQITYGIRVDSVLIKQDNSVEVTGHDVITEQKTTLSGDAVIITVSLPILSQMKIDFPKEIQQVLNSINIFPATKIIVQSKKRFWEKEVGQGGCTKTNLPINQLFYLSQNNSKHQKGLLICYTFGKNALTFGMKNTEDATKIAVGQIAQIHPEIEDNFEAGNVQAWLSDEISKAFLASLPPNKYNDGMKLMKTPNHPIYLAGDACSYFNGWMQGALLSGLNAAYHLFSHDKH